MILIYSHENAMVATNIKNLLELDGISVQLKNEFAAGAAGDLSAFDTWIELWVDPKQKLKAMNVINQAEHNANKEWFCRKCKEANNASFEVCWQCGELPE